MATKAELEAELAQLKAQLAANNEADAAPQAENTEDEADAPTPFEISEDTVKDLAKELESFATEKPMLTLLAAFLVGYVVGRAR